MDSKFLAWAQQEIDMLTDKLKRKPIYYEVSVFYPDKTDEDGNATHYHEVNYKFSEYYQALDLFNYVLEQNLMAMIWENDKGMWRLMN